MEFTTKHNLTRCGILNFVNTSSANGLLPVCERAIALTNAELFSTEHKGTNFSEIQI